jgi:hypothetical protein
MVTVYVPRPSASEVMDMMARWVARLYGVKVTVKVESPTGESNTIVDGRPQPVPVDMVKVPPSQRTMAELLAESKRCELPRSELVAAWNDLPDNLRCHPGLKRLYRAAQMA